MNILNEIDELLIDEGFDTTLTENSIEWKDGFGAECSVSKYEVTANNDGTIAWFQNNEVGKSLVRILFNNHTTFNWRPTSNHADWGFNCNFLRWFGNKLIIIYKEKHAHYLVKIENFNIDILFVGYITHICLTPENIFYIKKMDNKGVVQKISLRDNQTMVNTIPETNIEGMPNVTLKEFRGFLK